jgi:DNA-binding transcriptional MerR regulator
LDKAPDAFRTISEVADDLDVPQHVLRFWETRFTQIKPMKRSGGRRYYRPDDVNLLRGIRRLLYGEGYTIRGVQRILREHGIKSVQSLTDGSTDHARPCSTARHSLREDDTPRFGRTRNRGRRRIRRRCRRRAGGEPASPLSLRDLGPPLSDLTPPKAVVAKPVHRRRSTARPVPRLMLRRTSEKCTADGSRQAAGGAR